MSSGGQGPRVQQSILAVGLPITRNLTTGRVGSFYAIVGASIGTTDTTLAHLLGRIPSIYLVGQNSAGGVLYNASTGTADWSPSQIVLRATVAGTFTLLLG